MSAVKQLFQLQETEKEIDSLERKAKEINDRLSQNEAVLRAEASLKSRQDTLAVLQKAQRETEWEIEDITHKLEAAQKALYSGRTGNPKELLSQQQDVEGLKSRQGQFEIRSLDLMEQLESAKKDVEEAEAELKKFRAEKQDAAEGLLKELESLKTRVSELKEKKGDLVAHIPPDAVERYQRVKALKGGVAVVKIERGICCGCRISLPAREIREARGNRLICCSSCGRILFMP